MRDHLIHKVNVIQKQLDSLLEAKTSYEKFSWTNLNVVELVAYGLCGVISVESIKTSWDEDLKNLKASFSDFINLLGSKTT